MYVQALFDFPLPNNGERYDLSKDELVELLQKAYDNGWNYARQTYDTSYVKTSCYPDTDEWVTEWR